MRGLPTSARLKSAGPTPTRDANKKAAFTAAFPFVI
jgi:hypothetical protein